MKPIEHCPRCTSVLGPHPGNYNKRICSTCSTEENVVMWSMEFIEGFKYANEKKGAQ